MSAPDSWPYVIHMEPAFSALEHIDVRALAANVEDQWYNQTLSEVNDSLVRLGVVEGEYHWHQHDEEDEFFYVVDGRLIIELEGHESIELSPGQAVTIPRGMQHRPIAPVRTTMLMVERKGVTPTGS